jgi:Xaa-Pro dipeptidase
MLGPDYAARREQVRAVVADRQLHALVVTNPANVRYLSGFTGSNGAVLIGARAQDDRLASDFRYITQAGQESPGLRLLVERSVLSGLVGAALGLGSVRLGIEGQHVTVSNYDALRSDNPGVAIVVTDGVVEPFRQIKDDYELAALAQACQVSDLALAALVSEIRVGMTERDIARRLEWLLIECGADKVSFESIVAAGPHSAIPHHTPTDRALEAGDLLKIDFGALVHGYHADETRTFVVGAQPEPWQREIYNLVEAAQSAGIAALAVGASLAAVDSAARSLISSAGYGAEFGHGLGHGVGLDIHEAPMFAQSATGILAARTPVTVEPGIYLPGRGGVRIEDTLVVYVDGPVSLTTTTRELRIVG